jgi:hypothetical protein
MYTLSASGLEGVRLISGETGACEIRVGRSERDDSDYEWEVEYGHVAGDMVFGVSGLEAYEEGGCDDSGGEDVMWCRRGACMIGKGLIGEAWVHGRRMFGLTGCMRKLQILLSHPLLLPSRSIRRKDMTMKT